MGKKPSRKSHYSNTPFSAREFDVVEVSDDIMSDFASKFSSPPLCVRVGLKQRPYYLHRDLLRERCPYFNRRASFQDKIAAPELQDVVLADIDDDIFSVFVQYLYHQKYVLPASWTVATSCHVTAQLYILADMWSMSDFKAIALQRMKDLLRGSNNGYSFRYDDDAIAVRDIIKLLRTIYDAEDTNQFHEAAKQTLVADLPEGMDAPPDAHSQPVPGSPSPQSVAEVEPELEPELALEPVPVDVQIGWPSYEEIEQPPTTNEMRNLVARYAAYRLEPLKKDEEFRSMVMAGGEVVLDILSFVKPGTFS